MKRFPLLFLLLVACAVTHAPSRPVAAFHVSPSGNDSWSGKLARPDKGGSDGPFLTPERALGAVRELRAYEKWPDGGVIVYLAEGTYELKKSLHIDAAASGRKDAPLLWRPVPGDRVRLTGGRRIANFRPVSDPEILKRLDIMHRREIMVTSLRLQNIRDYGAMKPRGSGRETTPAAMELFCNGTPMTLSRWPNNDWVKITGTPGNQPGPRDPRSMEKTASSAAFLYEGDRPRRWADVSNIWMHGCWTGGWADSFERIKSIDTVQHYHERLSQPTNPPSSSAFYQQQSRNQHLSSLLL